MDLRTASVEQIPDFGVPFDAIVAVNVIGFWPDAAARLRDLRRKLAPAGRSSLDGPHGLDTGTSWMNGIDGMRVADGGGPTRGQVAALRNLIES